jgi:hypothetical protein
MIVSDLIDVMELMSYKKFSNNTRVVLTRFDKDVRRNQR